MKARKKARKYNRWGSQSDSIKPKMMKPEARQTRNHFPLRRINIVLLCLGGLLLCNLAVGWLLEQQRIIGQLAWIIQLLLSGVLVGLMIALFMLNRRALLEPIRSIAAWASRIRQGDFSARLAGHSEWFALTDDINRLAEWLESLAESKNRELLEQGARLKTQTHITRLLYDISDFFPHTADQLLQRTLAPMAEVLESSRIEFYRFSDDEKPPVLAAAWSDSFDPANNECVKIPLRLSKKNYGECHIWLATERFPLPDELSQLLYTLGRNIGMALERIELRGESARLARMRERTHLANELHDSLAQTIAGLRFQVRILDDLLHQQEEHAAWQQLENVENLVEEANAELRSLIGYFRAPIEPGGLHAAIKAAVARFRAESKIPLYFQEQWGAVVIPEKFKLEIVRIIQEALSNIRRHSRAKNARLLLRRDTDEKYTALVEDDGVGIDWKTVSKVGEAGHTDHSGSHIGLSVMAQRAQSIGAEFHIDSEPDEGTRILLSFGAPCGQFDGAPQTSRPDARISD